MVARASLTGLAVALIAGCAATIDASAPAGQSLTAVLSPDRSAAAASASHGAMLESPAGDAFAAGMVVDRFGVRLTGVRLTANGYVVDLRYRVLDPVKAQALLDRKVRPVLVDETTGNRFYVPVPPTVGALRQTSRNKVIHTDRDYFVLFANPDRRLQAGSRVTLYVGEERFGNLQIAAQTAAPAQPAERSDGHPHAR